MQIVSAAKVEITEFSAEFADVATKWGNLRVTDDGLIFARFPGSSMVFYVPANEVVDMCMAWMKQQQRQRVAKNMTELEKSSGTKAR